MQAMAGESLEIYGDGKQTRDFIYIDDLVRAIKLAAIKDEVGGEFFQIATNRETTVGEMVDILIPVLVEAGIENVSVFHGEKRVGDVMRNFSNTSKALKMLDWRVEMELEDGLVETIGWFKAQGN